MIATFMLAWFIGAMLTVLCFALLWDHRLKATRLHPLCRRCGYSMRGLVEAAACPECASTNRVSRTRIGLPERPRALMHIWLGPAAVGSAVVFCISSLSGGGKGDFGIGLAGTVPGFVCASAVLHVLLRWVPVAGVIRMAWSAATAMAVAILLGVVAALGHVIDPRPNHFLTIGGLVAFPFAGYGVALGLCSLSAPAWMREQFRRRATVESRG